MSVAQADCSQQLSLSGATYADAKANTCGEVGARGVAAPSLCFLDGPRRTQQPGLHYNYCTNDCFQML